MMGETSVLPSAFGAAETCGKPGQHEKASFTLHDSILLAPDSCLPCLQGTDCQCNSVSGALADAEASITQSPVQPQSHVADGVRSTRWRLQHPESNRC